MPKLRDINGDLSTQTCDPKGRPLAHCVPRDVPEFPVVNLVYTPPKTAVSIRPELGGIKIDACTRAASKNPPSERRAQIVIDANNLCTPPTATFEASAEFICLSGEVTLTWDAQHVTSVKLDGAEVAPSGSMTFVPLSSATYTLELAGPCGNTFLQKTVLVDVCPPAIADPVVTYSACFGSLTVEWVPTDGVDGYLIEIGDSESGPWSPYVTLDNTATSFSAANVFAGGKWLRFSTLFTVLGIHYRGVFKTLLPTVSAVAPPTFVSISQCYLSPRPLSHLGVSAIDGATVGIFNNAINPLIAYDERFVEVRKRLEFCSDTNLPVGDDGQPVVWTHPDPDVTIKWTRDGTVPTLATVNPVGNKALCFYSGFGHMIRAKAFKGECESPETIVLIDRKMDVYPSIGHLGESNTVSQNCDGPNIIYTDGEGNPTISGNDCQEHYGGISAIIDNLDELLCLSLVPGGEDHRIVRHEVSLGAGATVAGFPSTVVSCTAFVMNGIAFNRAFLTPLDGMPAGLNAAVSFSVDGAPPNTFAAGNDLTGAGNPGTVWVNTYFLQVSGLIPGNPCGPFGSLTVTDIWAITSADTF